jgi:DNA-binding MarR family transcriptional regulator
MRSGGSTLTVPIEITDPRLVRAFAHPLRADILALLHNRTASPSEIAAELGTPLSNTSYHVRQLAAMGFVELVRRTARRGAIEHHYTAKVRPTITDEGWKQLPEIVRRSLMDGWLKQTMVQILAAAEAGGFDREDTHHTRTTGRLDAEGWKALSAELRRTLERVDEVFEQSGARLADDPHADGLDATVVLMHFEGPLPKNVARQRPDKASRASQAKDVDELELDEANGP